MNFNFYTLISKIFRFDLCCVIFDFLSDFLISKILSFDFWSDLLIQAKLLSFDFSNKILILKIFRFDLFCVIFDFVSDFFLFSKFYRSISQLKF